MAEMREWLDRHGFEPARFVYDQEWDTVVVVVAFPNDREGEAFARRFDGQEVQPEIGLSDGPARGGSGDACISELVIGPQALVGSRGTKQQIAEPPLRLSS